MFKSHAPKSEIFRYTFSCVESIRWEGLEDDQRWGFLRDVIERVFPVAFSQGFERLRVYDRQGEPIVEVSLESDYVQPEYRVN